MQVGGKIFPYPVINHNKRFSNFTSYDFVIKFEEEENDKELILKNCRFETESTYINDLFNNGKIEIVLVVECSHTVYRKAFQVSTTGRNIILPKVDFTERVDISMFAYAKENFLMTSDEFDEDYRSIQFEIEKYDIIGANDGYRFTFKHSEEEDNLVKSIFSIISSENVEDNSYLVECDTNKKIVINLSKKDYENYKIIYTVPTYKEVFFNMLLVPSLIEGLSLCKAVLNDETKDLEDVGNRYLWFRSIQSSYLKLKGKELSIDDFKGYSPVSLAQELLGRPLGLALNNLVHETQKIDVEGENDDE